MTHILVVVAGVLFTGVGIALALGRLDDPCGLLPDDDTPPPRRAASTVPSTEWAPLEPRPDFGPWNRQAQLEFFRDLEALPTCAEVLR